MNTLNDDVLLKIISYLTPENFIAFYDSCPWLFHSLHHHVRIIIQCTEIVNNTIIQWFQQHKIQLQLLKSCDCTPTKTSWYRNGILHRDDDLPAEIYDNKKQLWYQNGQLHRDNDLPAVIYTNGRQEWYQNGLCHRDNDLPAVVSETLQIWYQNGLIHRDGDQPAHIDISNQLEIWYQNGLVHRDGDQPAYIDILRQIHIWYQYGLVHRDGDQPAAICNAPGFWFRQEWYRKGLLHRSGGKPAVVYLNGKQLWYRYGCYQTIIDVAITKFMSWFCNV